MIKFPLKFTAAAAFSFLTTVVFSSDQKNVGWNSEAFPWADSVVADAVNLEGSTRILWKPEEFRPELRGEVRYIDYESGDDQRDGTTPESAWKHQPWDKNATAKATESAGVQTYVLKKGVTYYGALVARESGKSGEPIQLTVAPDWGNGPATISGAYRVPEWKKVSTDERKAAGLPEASDGNLWVAEIPSNFRPHAAWAHIDGNRQRLNLARDPNWTVEDPYNHFTRWHRVTSVSGQAMDSWIHNPAVFTDKDPKAYVGATLWIDTPNSSGEFSITGPTPSRINDYQPGTSGVSVQLQVPGRRPQVKSPFFLENLPRFLDEGGEWYFDAKSRRFYLWMPKNLDPNSNPVNVAQHRVILDIPNQSWISVSGLVFTENNSVDPKDIPDVTGSDGTPWARPFPYTQEGAIRLLGNVSNVNLNHLEFLDLAGAGVVNEVRNAGETVSGIRITDCRFENVESGGMLLARGPMWRFLPIGELTDIKILRNQLTNIGMRNTGHAGQAINLDGLMVGEVAGNIVHNVAAQGINIWAGKFFAGVQADHSPTTDPLTRILVHRNQVTQSLIHKTDFGGIEGWGSGTTYFYNNISANAIGWVAHREEFHKNVLFYLDGQSKSFTFNNIAWSDRHPLAWQNIITAQGFKHVRGRQNILFNNTSFDIRNHYQKESEDGDLQWFVGNLMANAPTSFMSFWGLDEAVDIGWMNNHFSGEYGHLYRRWRGEEFRTLEEIQERILPLKNIVATDVGWMSDESPWRDAEARDFRLADNSSAIDRGATVFVPWALYGVVGEWHFLPNRVNPSKVWGYDLYPQPFHTNARMVSQGIPDHHLAGSEFTIEDYVSGPLESWTRGALQFNGSKSLMVSHDRLTADIPYPTERGKSTADFPGEERNSLRIRDGNFLIEAIFRADPEGGAGLVAGKTDAQTGYELRLTETGHAELVVRAAGNEMRLLTSQPVNDGVWHHLVAEVDRKAGSTSLYLDGKPSNVQRSGTLPAPGESLDNTSDFVVGKDFHGALDYLRVSQGTLADALTTIEELMAWQFNGPAKRDFASRPARGAQRDIGALESESDLGLQPIVYSGPTSATEPTADPATGAAPDAASQLLTGPAREVKMEPWGAVSLPRSAHPDKAFEAQVVLVTETVTGSSQQLVAQLHPWINGKRQPEVSSVSKPVTVEPFAAGPFYLDLQVDAAPGLDRITVVVFISPDGSLERKTYSTELTIEVSDKAEAAPAAGGSPTTPASQVPGNLVPQGSFANGMDQWEGRHGPWELRAVEVKTEDGRSFARLSAENHTTVQVVQPVNQAWKTVTLSFDSRRSGVLADAAPHEVFTAEINFKDADGKDLLDWKRAIFMSEDTDGWETVTREYEVPEGAATMIAAMGTRAKAGIADYANLTIIAK